MAKITVVVPVYKVEKYIHRCVDSIISQTFSDFDLVLVDDGSPDKCGRICDEYEDIDTRIHTIHRENGGLSVARNTGIEWALSNSNSEWITFIDSDDWIHPRYLESLFAAVNESGLFVAISDYETTEGNNPVVDDCDLNANNVVPERLYCDNNILFTTAWGKLYKKKEFRELKYPFGKFHEDEFTTWKILFKYSEIAVIRQPLYAYYINSEGIIRSEWSIRRLDVLDAFEERLLFFNNVKKYPNARNALIKHYQWHLMDSIKQVKERFPNNKKLNSALLKRLRRFLREADYSIYDHEGLYEIAYPQTYKFRWGIAVRIKKKG